MKGLADVASIIWSNFLGFDLIIFILAALNAYCCVVARRMAIRLHKTLHRTIFLPEQVLKNEDIRQSFENISEGELVDMRKKANGVYAIFVNTTGIFPLLGILGTVISLIPLVADMSNLQSNFFAALTSTFWGLVFAIAFKFLDGFFAPRVEENNTNISLYLKRHQNLLEEAPCETEASSSN